MDARLVRFQDSDGDQVAHPAGGTFFAGGDKLEGTVVRDRFSVLRVGNQYGCIVDVGRNFAERIDHLVAIGSGGDEIEQELLAVGLVGNAELGKQIDERHAGVGLVGFGVLVVDGNGFMGQRGQGGRGPFG